MEKNAGQGGYNDWSWSVKGNKKFPEYPQEKYSLDFRLFMADGNNIELIVSKLRQTLPEWK